MLNPRKLIYIDKLIRLFFQVVLSFFISTRKKEKRLDAGDIFILKMMGIGSITRIYKSLREQNVDFNKVLFISLASNKPLFEALNINSVYYLKDNNLFSLSIELIRLVFFIRNKRPSYVINYERASNFLGLLQILSVWCTRTRTISYHDIEKGISSQNDSIFAIKNKSFQELIDLSIKAYVIDTKKNETPKQNAPVRNGNVLININASNYMPYRKYSVVGFAEVIKSLYQWDNSLCFDLIGNNDERSYVDSLIDTIDIDAIKINNRCGVWSLSELMKQLASCRLFITNDSGPMHLAALVNTSMIVVWGPTSSKQFGYQHSSITNIELGFSCAPCFQYAKSKATTICNQKIDCLLNIPASDIFEVAKNKLAALSPNMKDRNMALGY